MTGVAVVTALAASVAFGISSVADQRSTKRVGTRRALSPRILADLVRQPLWLTAIAANIAGFALQVVALSSGSLALVQPILVCDIRPLALALACGVNYGTAAFAVKLVTSEFGGGPVQVFTSWPVYVFAVVGPAGFILNQDAFQQGAFIAPVQAIITAADPVVSIALGIVWLDVRLRGGPAAITGEVVALLLMTVGIVIIAHASAKFDMPGRPGRGAYAVRATRRSESQHPADGDLAATSSPKVR